MQFHPEPRMLSALSRAGRVSCTVTVVLLVGAAPVALPTVMV
ncbi:hypothetical protein ACFVRU_44190 [Streptomyces sp. NPDC057927]